MPTEKSKFLFLGKSSTDNTLNIFFPAIDSLLCECMSINWLLVIGYWLISYWLKVIKLSG
jgi:hypothetical protein